MRWPIAILWIGSLVAHAAPHSAPSFSQLSRQAEEARLTDHLPLAVELYQKAVQLRPAWSEGWWWLGSIYYEQDLYAEAHDAFQHSLANDKKLAPADAFLGLCEYEMRDYSSARTHLRRWQAAGAPGDASLVSVAGFRWAELLIQDGRFFEALFRLNGEVHAHGPNPSLVEAMGLAWMQMKNVPEDYPQEKREMVWLAGSAAAWMSASKMDRAQEFLNRLEAHYGNRPNVHFLRGFVYESVKDSDAAISEYTRELEIAPRAVTPMIQLALLLADAGRQEEAMAAARQAVLLEPQNARSHYALGRVLEAGEQWAASASELEIAGQLSPNAPKVHFQLSKVYRKLGRKEDANREAATFELLNKKTGGQPAAEDPASLSQGLSGRGR